MLTEFKMLEEIKAVGTQIIYLSKSVENANLQLKDLNVGIRNATSSSDRHARAMKWLTAGLVILGLAPLVAAYVQYRSDQSVIEGRKSCYQTVLQTSNIDLNYKNCLRSKGLME